MAASPVAAQINAAVTINAATTVTSFIPEHVFGANMAYWISATDSEAVSAKVQAAGNYFLRFPGGSSSDDYHWNSTGSYNASNYWVPSETSYTAGFQGCQLYRGTTSSGVYASNIDDGNTATAWLSNVDTDLPNHQWVYIDLGATNTAVSAVSIIWGTPYATSFEVQYDNSGATPYTAANETTTWTTTSAGTVTGTTGTQVVNFTSVNTRWVRVLMTASSAGAGGAYSIAELYVFNGATQVSVNNSSSSTQSPMVTSSTDPASANNGGTCAPYSPNYYQTNAPGSTDFATFMAMANASTPKGIPLLTVNVGTGTPAEAAAWVYYANITMGYGIKYWQIGNETNGNWETGGPMNANDYGRRFIEYATAMKAVDSSITIVGPVSGSPNSSSNAYDGNSYIQDFLLRLYNNPGGSAITAVGGIDYHWYPQITAYPAGYTTSAQLANFPTTLTGWMSPVGLSPSTMPVIMSEYNNNAGNVVADVQEGQGLWTADWLGTFIQDFGPQGFSNIWDVMNGGNDHTSPTGGDNGYLDNTSPTFQPHAAYWAMQLMATDWAISGDSRSHQLVNTGSSAVTLASFADYRPDGGLSLMVINLDSANSYATTIKVNGYSPATTANLYTFNTSNYVWQTTTTPYNANPDTAPVSTLISGVSNSFVQTLSPSSISVIQFNPSAATSTFTFTPSNTFTSTITKTATNTISPTFTKTFTNTPTATGPTSTFTLTATATQTYTITATPAITPTPTNTNSYTPSPTPPLTTTATNTNTMANTASPTITHTVTNTPSATVSRTPSFTPTSVVSGLTLFPNPGTGPSVSLMLPTTVAENVEVEIFTLSFRKVQDHIYPQVTPGSAITLPLTNSWGNALANGLYYVVAVTPQKKSISKLLVLR